jgi:hypothetical protein
MGIFLTYFNLVNEENRKEFVAYLQDQKAKGRPPSVAFLAERGLAKLFKINFSGEAFSLEDVSSQGLNETYSLLRKDPTLKSQLLDEISLTEEASSPSGLPAGSSQSGASSVSPTETNNEETQVTTKQASSPNLGAQVSDVKHLDRLLRLLNVLRRSENVPEVPESASDRDVMEFCIQYLQAKGLITTTTDEDGNVIVTINNNALNHPDETVRRFVEAIQRWVINPEGGVRAVNFQGKDGVWMIVGFESELQNKDTLEHEQQEIKFRKQGLSWTEAHNQAVAETGKGQRIDREEAAKRRAGRQDEIGAMQGGSLDQSVLQGEFGRRNFNREVTEKLRQATEDDLTPSDIGTKIKWQANKIRNLLEQRKQARRQDIKASPEFIEEQLKKLEGNSEQFTSIYREMVLGHRIVDMEKGNYIKLYQETKEIFDRIVRAMGFNPEDFELYLTDIGQPNAYALRWDNKVTVDINMVKALVENNYSKGALAFVLGHELRHAIQWLDDILGGKEVEVGKKLSIKEMISTKVAGHSDEYDADYFALTLMSDAGYSVRGALDVFNVLYDPQGLAKLLAMDHPPKDKRVRKIREAINGWYWESWDKVEEYFSIETRYESSRRTRLGVFRDSVREVKTYDELMLLINSAHTVQELLMAISKGYQSALKSGVTEKGSFILSKALQAFRNKLANLLVGNPVGRALLDIIENGTVFASYNDHKLYTDDLMKELVKQDPTAAQELEQFFKNEQARIGDLVKENLVKLSNDELDILLKDPLGSSYGGWGFQTNVYRQMVQNITSAKQFDLDKAWHVLDISSGQYLAGVASELMIWILRNGALANSFTTEQWKKYLSYGKFFDGVMEPQRLGEFLAEFRPAALSRPALKEALVEHARTSAPRTADWLEDIFQGDLKSWREGKGNEMILLGQGKSFDEDLDSILGYPVLMTEMIFDSNTSAKAPNRVIDKIWGMLSGKHIAGVKEKSRFAVVVLEKTAKIKISRSTLDREQIGPLYEEFLEAIISYEAEIGSRNSPLSGLDIFLKSGGVLGLNEIRHYVSKYADVLSQDDLQHVLVLLDSVKESWRNRYSSWDMFRDTTGEFDNFWRDLLLPIQYHILLKKLGKDQFLIRNGANWFPNENYDVVASFFNGELGIGSRGNFLESRKIGYQNKHRLNRMNLAGSNAEPAIRILFSIVDGPESFDSLKEVINQTLPASVVRNFLLYGLLLKELRSMGVEITPEQILNEELILSKMRVLSPEQSNQISEKIKTLEPLFIRDSNIAGQNSQEKGSAMRNAFDEEVEIPAMDQKDPNNYEDALYAEEGGRASQLNVFVPMLDSFLLEQVINSNISFSDKLKEIESRLPKSSTRDYWLNRLLSNHQGVIGEDIANALPLFKDRALRSHWGLAGLDKVFDERRGFSSQQEEIDTVRRFFPEPCYLRDDILLQTMERWVHRPEDDMVTEHLYQNPSYMRQQSQQRDLLSGSMLFSIVPHLTPIGRVNLLLWIMGVSDKKPKWMERFEHFYEVNFDSMRKTMALPSEHYKNAGKTDRRLVIEKIVWGEEPIFQDKNADRVLRESLFEAAVGNRGTPIMRDVFDAVFESADNERKLFLIGRLLEVVQAIKFSSNGNSSDEDLTNRITGVFLQAMGIVGVKTGQALGIKYLEDKADPIHRRVVFDMIKKIYGDFGKKFEGVYDRLGSASIKNVFRARLVNGDEVALKVKRPDVSKTVEDDMNFFEKVIGNLRAKGHVIPAGLVSKVRKMIDEEMDFNFEAFVNQPTLARNVLNRQSGNLGPIASLRSGLVERRLADRFQKAEGEYTVHVPQAVEEQGNTLLLEELVSQPIPLSNKEALRQQGLDPEDVKKAVRDEMLRQIFVDGIYQLDPNRGNILIQVQRVGDKKEVVINLIDVGAVGHLNNLNKLRLAKVLDAIDARSPKKILFYLAPLHALNARMGQDIADILATDAVREVKLLNVLDYLEKNGVKVSEEWMGIMRFMAAGKYLFEEHKTDQVITPIDSHGTQTSSQGSSPIDRGFGGNVGEVDSRAFADAWRSGRNVEISPEHLAVLQDSSMGRAFRTPQVRLISRQAMDGVTQGANVVRLGNQVLVVGAYWNSLSEDERLDVLMHEGMADWLERERPGMPAEDVAIDLEGLKRNEAERRAEHRGDIPKTTPTQRYQTIDDALSLPLEEISDTEADGSVITLYNADSKNPESVREELAEKLAERHWWLNRYWKEKAELPHQQIRISINGSYIDIYNWDRKLTIEQINLIASILEKFASIGYGKALQGLRYILIDNKRSINPQSNEEYYGYGKATGDYICLYPRALDPGTYRGGGINDRLRGVSNLEGALIHELSHGIADDVIQNEWMNKFSWRMLDKSIKIGGFNKNYQYSGDEERLVSSYASTQPSDDICEAMVAALMNPQGLDMERLEYLQQHFLRQQPAGSDKLKSKYKVSEGEEVTLPKIISPVKYSISTSQIRIVKPSDSTLTSEEGKPTSSPSSIQGDKKGGIDFRALPIINQQINMGMLKLSPTDLNRLGNINLDSEWAEIQNMVNAGIIPSNERVKEYVLASCLRQNLGNQMNKVLGCIADIMRMEEDRVVDADTELKDMLVLIEAGKPETELQCGLSQIKISPQEPKLVVP